MPLTLDPLRLRLNRARYADFMHRHPQLPQEVGLRLVDHLEGLKVSVKRLLLVGALGESLCKTLCELFPSSKIVLVDECIPLLKRISSPSWFKRLLGEVSVTRVAGSMELLPFANASFDLVIAHGPLPWCDPKLAFAEARRVLGQDGLLLFSSLGPDTFKEWRGAGSPPMLQLIDMHDLADLASYAGLTSPVVDMEFLTVNYGDIKAIVQDLRSFGGGNALEGRARGLMTPRAYQHLNRALELTRTDEGIPQTLELIYGHAWNTRPLVTESGRPIIPIQASRN